MLSFTKTFVPNYVDFVLRKPLLNILFTFILVGIFAPGNLYFQEKYDVRVWFQESDPNIQLLDVFERRFGNDESLVIALHSPSGIFDKETIETVKELTDRMWTIPQVVRVESLTNYNDSQAIGDEIFIGPFIDYDDELTADFLESKKIDALSHKVLPNYLVSEDLKSVMIFARLVPTLDGSPNYEAIVAEAENILSDFEGRSDYEFYLIGEAGVNDAFRSVPEDDGFIILPILIVVVFLYLFLTFRHFVASTLPLVITGMCITMTMGLCFYLGMAFNSVLTILPAILIAICIADSVHVLVTYFQFTASGEDSFEATRKSLVKNFTPTLLTSLSTMLGFFSLTVTELVPIRELGLLAGFGCFMAWVLTIHFVGPMMTLLKLKTPAHFYKMVGRREGHPYAFKLANVIHQHCGKIVLFFLSLFVISVYFGSQNMVNSNPYDYFRDGVPIREANKFIQKNFGGSAGPEIFIQSGEVDGVKDPHFLAKVEELKDWLDSQTYVTKTIDVIDIIKQLNQNLNGGEASHYVIPEGRSEIAEILFLYTMSLPQGMDLNNRVTANYDSMRMTVLWDIYDTRGWLKHVDILEEKFEEIGLNAQTTGKFLLFQRMMDYVVMTFFTSITTALFLVGLLLMIIFRSVKLGLLSLAPNLMPLAFGAAFMKLVGMDLNIGSALVAAVTLGIAVDDTIHFLSNLYRQVNIEKKSLAQATAHVFTFTGSALLVTTLILISAFGLYTLGDFIPNINFGLLCAVVLTSALVVDLFFLPAILMWVRRVRQNVDKPV